MSDVHQILPHRDVFKVFSTERIEEEVCEDTALESLNQYLLRNFVDSSIGHVAFTKGQQLLLL